MAMWRCVFCFSFQWGVGAVCFSNGVDGDCASLWNFSRTLNEQSYPLAIKYYARTDANKGNPTV